MFASPLPPPGNGGGHGLTLWIYAALALLGAGLWEALRNIFAVGGARRQRKFQEDMRRDIERLEQRQARVEDLLQRLVSNPNMIVLERKPE